MHDCSNVFCKPGDTTVIIAPSSSDFLWEVGRWLSIWQPAMFVRQPTCSSKGECTRAKTVNGTVPLKAVITKLLCHVYAWQVECLNIENELKSRAAMAVGSQINVIQRQVHNFERYWLPLCCQRLYECRFINLQEISVSQLPRWNGINLKWLPT